jgi:hypothetical protein
MPQGGHPPHHSILQQCAERCSNMQFFGHKLDTLGAISFTSPERNAEETHP